MRERSVVGMVASVMWLVGARLSRHKSSLYVSGVAWFVPTIIRCVEGYHRISAQDLHFELVRRADFCRPPPSTTSPITRPEMGSWRCARPLVSLSASRSLASARGLRVSAHTLDHPTPASLEAHISTLPPSSTLLFTLSTSIPAESLDPLLGVLNSFHSPSPSSSSSRRPGLVGSFHQSAAHIPELAIAAFTPSDGEGITTFYSDASGRAPASVGRWYRTDEPEWPEDERGGEVGELSAVLEGKGWEGVWSARGNDASVELGSG